MFGAKSACHLSVSFIFYFKNRDAILILNPVLNRELSVF